MKSLFASILLVATLAPAADSTPWLAGTATRKLTPAGPIWLAGYGNRAAPSNGVDIDVFAKALALDDRSGGRVVIVTMDLVSVPLALRQYVDREAMRLGLKPEQILINCSHTHSAPLPWPDRIALEPVFSRAAKPADVEAVNQFEPFLIKTIVELIDESVKALAPARLEYSHARAGFAMNRRRPEPNGTFTNNPYPDGPVDHDVPVLKVSGADGKIRAILFGYACHNTTLGGTHISGDYAGHAQRFLEASYPGATALFMLGCGGDQNPYPRGNMVPGTPVEALAKEHGRALANAVGTALGARARPVRGPLRSALAAAMLDYEPLPRAELAAMKEPTQTAPVVERAHKLMEMLERGEKPAPLACPVQVVRFGGDITLVAIGGETTVDYSLRLKKELAGPAAVWVAGYSNNVFGYLGSRRVIQEGGYEGISANTRILNHPGRFTYGAEDAVIATAHELVRALER